MNKIIGILIFFIFSIQANANQYQNKVVAVLNASSYTIYSIYGSNINRQSWESDILGNRVIPPGDYMIIDFEDGTSNCRYDLKATTTTGNEIIRYNTDLCRVQTWTITN